MRALHLTDHVAVVGLFVFLFAARNTAPAAEDHPITVAILDFEDKGPSIDLAPLRTALAEMLSGDLARYQGVRVVERIRVDQFLREANLQKGFVDAATAGQVAHALAAEYLVTGSFQAKDGDATVEVAAFKTGEEQPIGRWQVAGPLAGLIDLEKDLPEKILAALGGKPVMRPVPKPQPGPSPTVAVLALKNLSPSTRLEAMQSGFAEALQAHLDAMGNIRLVERERLYAVLKEQNLSLAGLTDPQTAIRVGRLLGAERLIYGSFVELGKKLRLDLRLVDTKTAAVLRAEAAAGATDRFAALLEDLALRLAADLAVEPPAGATDRVKGATLTRNLEAAIHLAEADQWFQSGRYAEAAKRYEQVLLLEPKNPYAAVRRGEAWSKAGEHRRALEAGQQAMGAGIVPPGHRLRERVYWLVEESHDELGQYNEVLELEKQYNAEFRLKELNTSHLFGTVRNLCNVGRRQEVVPLLEKISEEQKARGDLESYAATLRVLHSHLLLELDVLECEIQTSTQKGKPLTRKEASELTRRYAVRALELHDRIIKEIEKTPRSIWRRWEWNCALPSVTPWYYDEDGGKHSLGSEPRAMEERLVRVLRVLAGNHQIGWDGGLKLAEIREQNGNWQGAVDAYRAMLHEGQFINLLPLSDLLKVEGVKVIRARCHLADILREHLNKAPEAREEYRRLIEEFGLANGYGAQIATGLHALGESMPNLGRAALVWGCEAEVWRPILKPMGYRVHSLAQYHLSTADLAPYSLVILVRPGCPSYSLSLTPENVLALRNYVAAGGSLLVVVSPGWEPAHPGIYNPLLSLFGVHAGQEMAVCATSTRIADHPITKGSSKILAKNAIHLRAPPESALIQAGDRNVLVALPYRQGRVVIASLGQWFRPDPSLSLANPPAGVFLRDDVPAADLPLESGDALHLPLLRNVLAWLIAPSGSEETAQQRKLWSDAMAKSLEAQFQLIREDRLAKALQYFVDHAKPGFWKEEALWAAGEASLNAIYTFDEDGANYGGENLHLEPKTEYYERLAREFPQSPLCPFAKWRHADCKHREALYADFKRLKALYAGQRPSDPIVPENAQTITALFEKIDAPKESYAWAWTELRLGVLYFRAANYEKAREHFRKVAESFDPGPEKGMALLNAALCYQLLGNQAEAIRLYKAARALPDIQFMSCNCWEEWSPLEPDGRANLFESLNQEADTRVRKMSVEAAPR